MRRLFALTRVVLKTSNDALFNQTKSKKRKNPKMELLGKIALYAFLFIYLGSFIYFISNAILESLIKIGQPSLIITLLFTFGPMVALFFAVLSIPGIYYFSKDVERYLVLPVQPWEIVLAKFLATLIFGYAITIAIYVPVLANYFIVMNPGIAYIFFSMVSVLTVGIIPLAIALLVVTVLMTFVPFFRNKDFFTYFSIFIVLIPTLYLSLTLSSMSSDPEQMNSIINAFMMEDNNLINSISFFLPTSAIFARAIYNQSLVQLIIAVGASVGVAFIAIAITQPLYFRGVVGIDEQTSKKKQLNETQFNKELQASSLTSALIRYDIRNILRTPIFLYNYYGSIVIMPLVMGFSLFLQGNGLSEIVPYIKEAPDYFATTFYVLPVLDQVTYTMAMSVALGLFFGNMDTSSSTAISREGSAMESFLSFPIEMATLVHAKAKLSILTSLVIPGIITTLAIIILRPNILTVILFVIGLFFSVIFINYLSLIVDVFSPSLDWETEQQAIKGNMKQVIVMIPFIFLPIALVFASFFISNIYLVVGITLLLTLGNFLLYIFTTKLANTRLIYKIQSK